LSSVNNSDLEKRIAGNLAAVRARMNAAARSAGRDPSTIHLVAVSKTFGLDHVRAAVSAGQRDFGENKVQEGLQKIDETRSLDLRWHLIGHLQSNKAKRAAASFSWIQSIDSADLLARVDRYAAGEGAAPEALVQVDLAGESTKFGAPVSELDRLFETAASCQAVRVVGLMLLPPWSEDPEVTRPWFQRLRGVRDDLAARGVPPHLLGELSMGMSHDFEVAIEEGATIVRVGTAIFGRRKPEVGSRK
jgi:pyridoxal phosphate enzyme (YggS family)